ncbi:MAG TPA: hypothetical protein PKA90_02300 [Ignavibacteria bacterium]|nr:hypothetical protein [Ignavibacteria bacterium]HMR39240.1 hypothetical protein [Ignavibacteria bacterium]
MKFIFFLLLFSGYAFRITAQDSKEIAEDNAAANATNPLAFVTKLQFQPNYSWKDEGGDQLSLISRISKPTKTLGLPFIKSKDPSKVYTIYRLEVPVIGQTLSDSQSVLNATGISDMVLLDVIAFKQKWGLIGIGPALLIPSASPEILGTGKWSAGPVGVLLYTGVKKLQLGFLAQQFFSFAGSEQRKDVNFMLFQPIVNKIFVDGYFMQISPIMKFDWEISKYNIPVSLALGKAFAKNLSMFLAGEYVLSGPGTGDLTFRINVNAMFAAL